MKSDAVARAHMYQKLIRPIITEKASSCGNVVLEVDRRMTKLEIREAFESVFNVKVMSVRTINQKGKVKGSFGKIGRRKDIKKAYISLVEGQNFELIEGL
jgi:large subunit ribosomal protein L23